MSYRLLVQSIRLGLYSVVVILTVTNHLLQEHFFNWNLMLNFYGWSAVGILIHGLSLVSLEKFFKNRFLVFLTFIVDVFLICALLIGSGLNQTLFLFMFLLTIILAGLVFQLRGALLIAVLCSISFTVSSWFGPDVKAMAFLFMLVLNNIAFFAVALLSGYLSDQLNLFAEKLESQNLTLKNMQQLNELIVETIPSALLTIDEKGQILTFNPSAENLFQQDVEGKNFFDLLPEFPEKRKLKSLNSKERVEAAFQKESNHYLWGIQIFPQQSDFERATYLVVIENLTEIKKLEFAVRQSEKLAAVGGLAAGIAHEIRNPLAGISGSIELLSQSFETADDKKLSKIILKEIDRLNNLISEFLDFAKPEKPPTDLVDLRKVLDECIQHVQNSFPFKVDIQKDLASSILILGYSDKLRQAFLNILINAFQAMEKSEEKVLRISSLFENDRVLVTIRDSGSGIKPETLKRIFEPFHTTKAKGTGLGLAITHKILESHSALIFVNSEEGLGTEFLISFRRENH